MTEGFTYEQAHEICEDFSDLVDTEFHLGGRVYFVEDVLVAPSGMPQEELAVLRLLSDRSAMADDADSYDVLIAASDVSEAGPVSYIDIRSYMVEKGVNYNMPGE